MDLNLRRILHALRHWWWLVVLGPLIAGGAGYMVGQQDPPVYASKTRLIVGQSLTSVNPDYGTLYASERLVTTYTEFATSYPILEGVARELGISGPPEALAGHVSAFAVEGTEFLDISATGSTPEEAAAIANAVANQLILQSPTGPESTEARILRDVEAQMQDLQLKIADANDEIESIQGMLNQFPDELELERLTRQRNTLQERVSEWQATLAQLYETFLGNRANTLAVLEAARPNAGPIAPLPYRTAMLTGLLGLMVALGLVLLFAYLDNRVKSADDIAAIMPRPVLASIPRFAEIKHDSERLITSRQPNSPVAESYRALRTNLQFSSIDQTLQILAVTSPGPSEGKTTVAANLAIAMAQADVRVILIDADLRKPMHHRTFGIDNSIGLTSMLADRESLSDTPAGISEIMPNLRVIPSGPIPPNPSELLSSKRMEMLLWLLQQEADLLIVDTPPVLNVSDALALAPRAHGVLMVVEAKRTRRDSVAKVYQSLVQVGARVLGVALNKVDQRSDGYYYYYASDNETARRPRRGGLRRRSAKPETPTS